ncbi:MAG: tRNA pseudouridine(38-40) synthase TruA [Pseudomonadota bacterium]|nr:MAG: tRNA pseudouridine(38-40) synthase TruA [Pseudomonadota bacterium]
MRIALGIEYDGSPYSGWQLQVGTDTVQGRVEEALSRVAAAPVRLICAGRTDAGVHAIEQVAHFDTTVQRPMRAWMLGANANLPKTVSVLWAHPVNDRFHARFSAQQRSYRYVIFNRAVRPTFLARRVTWEFRALDIARMQAGACHLIGTHDFSSYRALACQAKSPVRTLHRVSVTRRDELVLLDLEADGFLHHMVRNIAGVLMSIGAGRRPPQWAAEVLELRDRALGGVTAAPDGLYLARIAYPVEYGLPQLSRTSAVW